MIPTIRRNLNPMLLALVMGAAGTACSGDETGPSEDHTPVSYKLTVNGTELTQPYTLAPNQTTRVRIKFYNAANDDLDDVESGHYGLLTFSPTNLATAAAVTDHHFQFDVTTTAAGTGTVVVSYGHGPDADEHAFPAVTFRVQ